MRVSECVGIDLDDIDFKASSVKVTRKGGNETVLYFGDEVQEALLNYFEERKDIQPKTGSEKAFFLSAQKHVLQQEPYSFLLKNTQLSV